MDILLPMVRDKSDHQLRPTENTGNTTPDKTDMHVRRTAVLGKGIYRRTGTLRLNGTHTIMARPPLALTLLYRL